MPASSFDDLFRAVRKGEIPAAVYLYGPEDALKEDLLREIVDRVVDAGMRDFNHDIRSARTLEPDAVEALCTTLPMMAERRLVVIRDVEEWGKRARAKAAVLRYLERPVPETVLVLVQGAPDPFRDRDGGADPDLAKAAVAVEVERLPLGRAEKWVARAAAERGITLEPEALAHLVRAVEGNLAAARTELEKLAASSSGDAVGIAQVEAMIGVRHGETQYDWVRAVLAGDTGRAARILPQVLDQPGVSGVGLVTLLGTELIGLGIARDRYDRGSRGGALSREIFQALLRARPPRLDYRSASDAWSRLAEKWPARRIRDAIRATLAADQRLKFTALSDSRGILVDLVMQLGTDGPTAGRPDGPRGQGMRRLATRALVTALLLLPLGRPAGLPAQQDPRLVSAVRLAQDGLSDSARKVVARILASIQPADSLYPEVLYTVGLLAATQQDRRLYLRRVIADHASSPWADDALLSLLQLEYVADPEASARYAERLVRDYPDSPLIPTAALWGARAAADRRDGALACRLADRGLAAAGVDVELRNQLEFQKQRCTSLMAMSGAAARADSIRRADSVRAARAPAGNRPTARPPRGWYVQLSAVRTRAAADVELGRLARLDYRGFLLAEAGLLKVRAGPFASRSEAALAMEKIKARLGGTPFVVRVP
ncbi:MAG: DNA polymerase III subunit delta [Gemmatimonadales bacterium]